MTEPIQILIVEDDKEIRGLLADYMADAGFAVTAVDNGIEARRAFNGGRVDLVLLDLGLPGEDGLELARDFRDRATAGLIILTGRGEVVDRVVGLEIGADDYIAKPYHLREVLARSRSVLRRMKRSPPAAKRDRVRFGNWEFDLMRRKLVSTVDGAEVRLTTLEFQLLEALIRNPARVLSRERLLDIVSGRKWEPYDRAIDVQIARLRRKIEDDPATPRLITTVRGEGYMFTAEVSELYTKGP